MKKILIFIFTSIITISLFSGCSISKKSSKAEFNISNFNSKTIKGEKITSDIIKKYDLTMVNVFATWCGPCVKEMLDLQNVKENLPKNVNMIAICEDAGKDEETLKSANEIINSVNGTFDVIIPDDVLKKNVIKNISGFPTTFFVDKNGEQVGDAILGVVNVEDLSKHYLFEIDERLKILNEKNNK